MLTYTPPGPGYETQMLLSWLSRLLTGLWIQCYRCGGLACSHMSCNHVDWSFHEPKLMRPDRQPY